MIHTARKVKAWFKEQRILVVDWPPFSPDLNPIKQLWPYLKRMVLQMHPELEFVTREDNIQAGFRICVTGSMDADWEGFDRQVNREYADRVKACKNAGGWHTKY